MDTMWVENLGYVTHKNGLATNMHECQLPLDKWNIMRTDNRATTLPECTEMYFRCLYMYK